MSLAREWVKLKLQLLCHTLDVATTNRSNTEINLGRNTQCSLLVPHRKKQPMQFSFTSNICNRPVNNRSYCWNPTCNWTLLMLPAPRPTSVGNWRYEQTVDVSIVEWWAHLGCVVPVMENIEEPSPLRIIPTVRALSSALRGKRENVSDSSRENSDRMFPELEKLWFKESSAKNLRTRDFLSPTTMLNTLYADGQVGVADTCWGGLWYGNWNNAHWAMFMCRLY